MPLTAMDIQQKTFGPELRGYNMDEVDDFLDEVVATLKDYDQRIRDAQDRIRALETELSSRGEQESAISRALLAAQRQADALLEEAREEADRIRADAGTEADRLRSDRETERMSLTQDIARMRATVADLKRRIVDLAASAGSDLDEMDSAIAAASHGLGDALPSSTYDGEEAVEDDWADVSEGFADEDASGWTEQDTTEEPDDAGWETPGSGGEREEMEDAEAVDPVDDSDEDEADEDEADEDEADQQVEPFGGLADELANEAATSDDDVADDDYTEAAPPSRRPWERGSV